MSGEPAEAAGPGGRLLYADERVLVVDKPAGVSMATSTRPGKTEADVLRALLAACGLAPAEGLRLVHRLDVGTSGVVLLARTAEAHRDATRAFQDREARKTYRALVWGHPVPARGLLDAPLGRDPVDGRRMRVDASGKPAVTEYATRRRLPGVADLSLVPRTGRTHQIRVHLSARGHPIVGDDLYGGATRWHGVRDPARRELLRRVSRPLLHAEELAIPSLGVHVVAPAPADFLEVLGGLGA